MNNLTNDKNIRDLKNRTSIKFNSGRPACICNRCSVVISRVYYNESTKDYTLIDGKNPPLLCQSCLDKDNLSI